MIRVAKKLNAGHGLLVDGYSLILTEDVTNLAKMIGDRIYHRIHAAYDATSVQACKDAGLYSPTVTAGKMTGMLLAAYSDVELEWMMCDPRPETIADLMVDCVLTILRAEGRTDI